MYVTPNTPHVILYFAIAWEKLHKLTPTRTYSHWNVFLPRHKETRGSSEALYTCTTCHETAQLDHPEDHNWKHHHENTKSYNKEKFSAILTVNIAVLGSRILGNVGRRVKQLCRRQQVTTERLLVIKSDNFVEIRQKQTLFDSYRHKMWHRVWGGYPILAATWDSPFYSRSSVSVEANRPCLALVSE